MNNKILLTIIVLFLLMPTALALDRDFQTGFEVKGFNADQPYAGSADTGHVNLYSGGLVKTQSLLGLKGRGLDLNLQATYNSNIFESIDFTSFDNPPSTAKLSKPGWMGYGWNFNMGRVLSPKYYPCSLNENVREYQIEFPDGSSTKLAVADSTRYKDYYVTEDGYRVDIIKPGTNQGTLGDDTGLEIIIVTDKEGTQYFYTHHVYPSVPVDTGGTIYDCQSIDPITRVVNPYTDNDIGDSHGTVFVQNPLAGIYLTRIQDVHGNYITVKYHDQNSRNQQTSWEGCAIGSGVSWGSPYIQEITDTMYRKISFEIRDSGTYSWQKLLDYVRYRDVDGNYQYLKFNYGYPSGNPLIGEGGIGTIKDCPAVYKDTGICQPTNYLRSVDLLNGTLTGTQLLPSWEFSYDKKTGELKSSKLSTGGTVTYNYKNLEAWYYDIYVTGGQPKSVKRRVTDSITVNNGNQITTNYFYRENMNTGSEDNFRRETWVVHPENEDGKRTIEMSEYISLNPFSYYLDVMDFKNGKEIKKEVYEFDKNDPAIIIGREDSPIVYDEEPGNGLYFWKSNIAKDIKSKTINHYSSQYIGKHEIYNLYHPVFGPNSPGIPDSTIPNRQADFFSSRLQGVKTTVYADENKITYKLYDYDKFNNVVEFTDYGFVFSADKGTNQISSPSNVCDGNNINKLNGLGGSGDITHNCYFQGTPSIVDDMSTGVQDYQKTVTTYLHEQDTFYLGSNGDGTCSSATDCDPIAGYRNKHFQLVSKPAIVEVYNIYDTVIKTTNYLYDEPNNQPHSMDDVTYNYDSDSKLTHNRHVAFQQGTIINTGPQSCTVKQGYLTKIRKNIITPKENTWVTEAEFIYDTSGNKIKTIFPTGNEVALGYDDPADLSIQKISNTCATIPPKANWPWGQDFDTCEGDAVLPPPFGFDKYYRALVTEEKNPEFTKTKEYNYFTGLLTKDTLDYNGDILENTYEYDLLGRSTIIKRAQDLSTPYQEIQYNDFEIPQKVIVNKKLKEGKVLVIDADGVNHEFQEFLSQSWTFKELLEGMGYDVTFYSWDDAGDFTGITDYEQYNLVIWEQGLNNLGFGEGLEKLFEENKFSNYYSSGGKFWVSGYRITQYLRGGLASSYLSLKCVGDCGSWIYYDVWLNEYLTLEGEPNSLLDNFYPVDFYYADSPDEVLNHNGITLMEAVRWNDRDEIMDRHDVTIMSQDKRLVFSTVSPWSLVSGTGDREYFAKTITDFMNIKGFKSPEHYFYDGLGRNYLIAYQDTTDGQWIVSTKLYDAFDGSVKKESKSFKVENYYCNGMSSCVLGIASFVPTDSSGVLYEKDGLKRLVKATSIGTDVIGTPSVRFTYGADYKTTTDKKGNSLKQIFDGRGNSITKEYAELLTIKKTVETTYDSFGNLDSVRVVGDLTAEYEFDNRGLLYSASNVDTGVEKDYDHYGRQISQANLMNEQVITNDYDVLGRLLSEQIDGYGTITYNYQGINNFGKLTSVTEPNANTIITYDNYGRVRTVTQDIICPSYISEAREFCNPKTSVYEYYDDDSIKSLTVDGQKIEYAIDELARVNTLRLDGVNVASFNYLPTGKISKIDFANEYLQEFAYYDKESDVLKSTSVVLETIGPGYGTIFGREYEYDLNDNINKQYSITQDLWQCLLDGIPFQDCPIDKQQTASYNYDNFNQLIQVTDTGEYGTDYDYDIDAVGRINSVVTATETVSYSYSGTQTKPENVGRINLKYDAAGRLIQKSHPVTEMVWSDTEWELMQFTGDVQGYQINGMLKLVSTTPSMGLYRYTVPVEYGKTYKVTATLNTNLQEGYGIVATGCHNKNGGLLGPECKLDNFDTSRKTSGNTNWKKYTWYVTAEHPTVKELYLVVYCYMSPPTYNEPAVGEMACRDISVKQVNEYYEYNAKNQLTELAFEDGNCKHYMYDFAGRRIYEDDSRHYDVTRYLYDGNSVVAQIDDAGMIDHCEVPTVPPPPPPKKTKLDFREALPEGPE